MVDALTTWLSIHTGFVVAIGAISFVLLAATLFVTPWFLAQLPHDYFSATPQTSPQSLRRSVISFMRTILGILMILLAFAVMLTPGPGLVLLVFGLALCDFPGKHKLLIKLVSQPSVLSALNWLRGKTNKPPFIVPPVG